MSLLQRKQLLSYQEAAATFIRKTKRCALFVDPGLGKTISTLTAFVDEMEELNVARVLVIGPPRVARKTWPDEIKAWAHTKRKSFVHIDGTVKQREKLIKRPVCFHIISIELMPWLLKEIGGDYPRLEEDPETGELSKVGCWAPPEDFPYDAVVIDESSLVKNSSTNRFRALRMMAARPDYLVLLTGTPSPNGLEDLWAQLYLIDGGKRLMPTKRDFKQRYFDQAWGQKKPKPKKFALNAIKKKIEDVCFTLREEDYADLPPRKYNDIVLDFNEHQAKRYRKFQRDLVLDIEESGVSITAQTGASIMQKLLQFANGVVYRTEEDGEKSRHFIHDIKLQALRDLHDELNGQPLLVAYQFKSDAERILKKFKGARMFDKRPETQDAWNRGEIPMLLAHPSSVAYGLNLQHGGCHCVWYGGSFSLEKYIQFNKRLHRKGQLRACVVHHLIVKGTMDEVAFKALKDKNDMQEELLNSLKTLLREFR